MHTSLRALTSQAPSNTPPPRPYLPAPKLIEPGVVGANVSWVQPWVELLDRGIERFTRSWERILPTQQRGCCIGRSWSLSLGFSRSYGSLAYQ